MAQPDADMRWLAMVMNFNDVYQPRRKKRSAGTITAAATVERDTGKERERGTVRANREAREREKAAEKGATEGMKGKGRVTS
jgi:gamma-tubulin complex component 3